MRRTLLPIAVLVMLGACANTGLRDLRGGGDGPDEFIVAPVKPLVEPESYSALPPPTPGGGNITDPQPLAEATAALGGRPNPGGAPDGGVVNYASRFGVNGDIRQTLAAEDESFRRRRARFTQFRLVPVDRYNQAYRNQALDPHRVTDLYRRSGVQTPSAPPQDDGFRFQ